MERRRLLLGHPERVGDPAAARPAAASPAGSPAPTSTARRSPRPTRARSARGPTGSARNLPHFLPELPRHLGGGPRRAGGDLGLLPGRRPRRGADGRPRRAASSRAAATTSAPWRSTSTSCTRCWSTSSASTAPAPSWASTPTWSASSSRARTPRSWSWTGSCTGSRSRPARPGSRAGLRRPRARRAARRAVGARRLRVAVAHRLRRLPRRLRPPRRRHLRRRAAELDRGQHQPARHVKTFLLKEDDHDFEAAARNALAERDEAIDDRPLRADQGGAGRVRRRPGRQPGGELPVVAGRPQLLHRPQGHAAAAARLPGAGPAASDADHTRRHALPVLARAARRRRRASPTRASCKSLVADRRQYFDHWHDRRSEMPKVLGTVPESVEDPVLIEIFGINPGSLRAVQNPDAANQTTLTGVAAAAGQRHRHRPRAAELRRAAPARARRDPGLRVDLAELDARPSARSRPRSATAGACSATRRSSGGSTGCRRSPRSGVATLAIGDGDEIEVDGTNGRVTILKRAAELAERHDARCAWLWVDDVWAGRRRSGGRGRGGRIQDGPARRAAPRPGCRCRRASPSPWTPTGATAPSPASTRGSTRSSLAGRRPAEPRRGGVGPDPRAVRRHPDVRRAHRGDHRGVRGAVPALRRRQRAHRGALLGHR